MVPVGPGTAWAGGSRSCHFPPDAEFPGIQSEVVQSHRFSATFQMKPGRPASTQCSCHPGKLSQMGKMWGCRLETEANRRPCKEELTCSVHQVKLQEA